MLDEALAYDLIDSRVDKARRDFFSIPVTISIVRYELLVRLDVVLELGVIVHSLRFRTVEKCYCIEGGFSDLSLQGKG